MRNFQEIKAFLVKEINNLCVFAGRKTLLDLIGNTHKNDLFAARMSIVNHFNFIFPLISEI